MIGIAASVSLSSHSLTFVHDAQSKVLADRAVEAMGGRENYDNTRYLSWVFFAKRFHLWDKFTGNIRIESGTGDLVLMNVHSKIGRAWQKGVEITKQSVLLEKMQWAYNVWINDSYWLVMPYKLHDPGVRLVYARADKTEDGRAAQVSTMTFDNVGVTPNNKYEVYFDDESGLVSAFAYFVQVADVSPSFNMPWANWQQYGNILLSDSRGERNVGPVQVFEQLPEPVFSEFIPALDSQGTSINGAKILR
jgi:hypothetical protein